MPNMRNNSLKIKEVKAFMTKIPEDRKVVANTLFNKLEFLNKILSKLELQIEEDIPTAALIKSYNDTVQRYSIICKQLIGILPKPVENPEGDPLLKFIRGE